jgi:hypothetical protein
MLRNLDLIISRYKYGIVLARKSVFTTTSKSVREPIKDLIYYTNGTYNLLRCHYRNINSNLILKLVYRCEY